jgi:hypothetical protein
MLFNIVADMLIIMIELSKVDGLIAVVDLVVVDK